MTRWCGRDRRLPSVTWHWRRIQSRR